MAELRKKKFHLGITDLFRLSLRIFRTHPSRTFLTILGMAVGIGTVLFLISLGYGLQYILIGKLVATEDSLISLEAFYPSESSLILTEKELGDILAQEETVEISPLAELTGEIKMDELSGYVLVRSIQANYFRLAGQVPEFGRVFNEHEPGLVVSNTALRLLNLEENEKSLGKELFLKVAYPKNESETELLEIETPFPIKGVIVDEYSPPFVFVSTEFLPIKISNFSRVFVKAKDIERVESLRDRLIEKGLLISARLDLVRQARRIMTIFTLVLAVFGITALVVAAIGMFNTMVIGFLERIFEIGIMKSIGATSFDVRNLFLMESLLIGLSGGVGGIFLGVLGGEVVNLGLAFLAKQLGGEPVKLFIYPWQFLVLIIVVSILVGVLAGFWPARKAARLSPKEAFLRK